MTGPDSISPEMRAKHGPAAKRCADRAPEIRRGDDIAIALKEIFGCLGYPAQPEQNAGEREAA
jgi:hypothetical protein